MPFHPPSSGQCYLFRHQPRHLGPLWLLIAALVLLWSPGAAWAGNGWNVGLPRAPDGPGIKAGKRSVVHPGVSLGVGFDANVFRTRKIEGISRGAYALPTAWVTVGNTQTRDGELDSSPELDGRNVDYSLGLALGYRAYLSGNEDIRAAGKFAAELDLHVMGRPAKKLSIYLDETLRRIGEPRNFEAARAANFNRLDHRLDLGLRIRPSGGRLSFRLGFHNELLYFEASDLTNGDRTANGLKTQIRWRFRDRMGVLVRYQYLKFYHFCCTDVGSGRNEDSDQHKVLGGFAGQLGEKWALQALGGWGVGLYKDDVNGPDHKNFIAEGGISYFPRPGAEVRASAHRTFDDALWGNYFTDMGGRLEQNWEPHWGWH